MSTGSRFGSRGVLLGLLVLVVAAGTAFTLAVLHENRVGRAEATDLSVTSEGARAAGLRRAGPITARALSYDGTRFDADLAASRKLMTAAMGQEYDASLAKVRDRVVRHHVVHRATAVASSVMTATPTQVQALVFLDTVTTAKGAPGRQLDTNRVVVTLVRRNGSWLIATLDAF